VHLEVSSALLMMRGLGTLLLPDGDPAITTLEWLPPPAALLVLADVEKTWDVLICGQQHPALLCMLLYALLTRWEVASEVAVR